MGLGVSGKLDHLVKFIRACQFYRLASLHLYVTHPPRSGRPVESFASIFQCCDPALLTSRPTLAGVIELARHCPELVTLTICELDLDAGTVPVPELEEDSPDAVPRLGWHGLQSFVASNVLQPCAPQKYVGAATVLDRVFRAINVEHSPQADGVCQRREGLEGNLVLVGDHTAWARLGEKWAERRAPTRIYDEVNRA